MAVSVTPTLSGARNVNWGWDYNLTHKDVTSPFPMRGNYYSDLSDDTYDNHHWTIAVESEMYPDTSTPGPNSQSIPIYDVSHDPNATPGWTRLQWVPHSDETGNSNWAVNLKTDLYTNPAPFEPGCFTWYAFGDSVDLHGGPLPSPDKAVFDVNLLYDEWLPAGGARVSVFWQGWWNGRSYGVDIDLDRRSTAWGPDTGQLIQYTRNAADFYYLQLNGAAMGLTVTPGVYSHIHVDWYSVLDTLIGQGALPSPVGGWANSATQSFYVATELMNGQAEHSGITSLWVDGFRISEGAGATTTVRPTRPSGTNITTYTNGTEVRNNQTGEIVQTLPATATDRPQFLSVEGRQYALNISSARSLGLNPAALRDYDGNDLGAAGDWQFAGLAGVRPGAAMSYILVNPVNGRWAEVMPRADGSFDFADHGKDGNTRVVGIYDDPLIALGVVTKGGPYDSQVRFLNDIKANHLVALGSSDYDRDGFVDLLFKLTNHSPDHHDDVYLRAILHEDGNIQYANYMTAGQFTGWMEKVGTPASVYSGWLTQI